VLVGACSARVWSGSHVPSSHMHSLAPQRSHFRGAWKALCCVLDVVKLRCIGLPACCMLHQAAPSCDRLQGACKVHGSIPPRAHRSNSSSGVHVSGVGGGQINYPCLMLGRKLVQSPRLVPSPHLTKLTRVSTQTGEWCLLTSYPSLGG
jgi:hypothetical protein